MLGWSITLAQISSTVVQWSMPNHWIFLYCPALDNFGCGVHTSASSKTGSAVHLAELKHQNLLITMGQLFRLVPNSNLEDVAMQPPFQQQQ